MILTQRNILKNWKQVVKKMAKYELTHKAVEDLAKIWEYTIDNWSEKQADKYYNSLWLDLLEWSKNSKRIFKTIKTNISALLSVLPVILPTKFIIWQIPLILLLLAVAL